MTAKKLSDELAQMQNGITTEWRGVTIERMNDHWLIRIGLGGVTLGKTPMAAAKYAVRFANALASRIEHKALEAIDNEAMTCTPTQRNEFVHQLKAYRNAASYADQWGLDIDELRATITKLTGVTKAEADARNK